MRNYTAVVEQDPETRPASSGPSATARHTLPSGSKGCLKHQNDIERRLFS